MSDQQLLLLNQNTGEYMPNSGSFCCEVCFKVVVMLPYFLLLSWRFIGLLLYSFYAASCFFQEKVASYRCKNFTTFSYADELEISWQVTSFINTLIVILVLVTVPSYEGYLSALRNNSRHARFWSLFAQLIVAVSYNIIVICAETLGISKVIEVMFILGEISTILVVYLWNTVPSPWREPRDSAKNLAYTLTLVVFILENLYLFVLTSTQAAFQVTGVNNFRQTPSTLHAITIVVNAGEATFYYAMMKFFWNKWFDDRKNLLINDNV
ncbi:hypothetical protein P5673_028906 [Acropora cervicornis]|uniref:Uncharacterized protein n=1 Tax=Acropora cervicornis TaxID=6130 RepID=A0AAD9PWB6_ACRCE|nr:hypothetical protein P5673_028900 [Acropora cervicornis]KAK2550391.1 hypothetical protein P5673_028906 [Acropora cervicornis]